MTRRKGEQKEEHERLLKAKKKRMMMTQRRDMKVLRILSHVKLEGGQRRKIWTRILTRPRM